MSTRLIAHSANTATGAIIAQGIEVSLRAVLIKCTVTSLDVVLRTGGAAGTIVFDAIIPAGESHFFPLAGEDSEVYCNDGLHATITTGTGVVTVYVK